MEKLYRSRSDRKFTGLCGGLAQKMGIDSTLIRVLVIITTFMTGGTLFWIYLIASFIVPKEPYHAYDEFGHRFRESHSEREYRNKTQFQQNPFKPVDESPIDAMMETIEKKAMKKELEELRARIAQFEKGEMKNGSI